MRHRGSYQEILDALYLKARPDARYYAGGYTDEYSDEYGLGRAFAYDQPQKIAGLGHDGLSGCGSR